MRSPICGSWVLSISRCLLCYNLGAFLGLLWCRGGEIHKLSVNLALPSRPRVCDLLLHLLQGSCQRVVLHQPLPE